MREDFDRFRVYSVHIQYLQLRDGGFPSEVLEDYMRLFPNTPILPHLRSINIWMGYGQYLPYLLGSSARNEPISSGPTLRKIAACRYLHLACLEGCKNPIRDIVAFGRSNGKLGGGLEGFRDCTCLGEEGGWTLPPAGWTLEDDRLSALALPPPEHVDRPLHRLRRLEVTHFLRELPEFFGRVARMQPLEHLKIAIPHETWELEEVPNEGTQHSASSLELVGTCDKLCPALNICVPPSRATQFRAFRLRYYLTYFMPIQAVVVPLLDLPQDIIPPDHLDTLVIDLLDVGMAMPKYVDAGIDAALKVDAFRPLLRYTQMVKLHLGLPFHILLDIDFLRALAAVMGETLRHLVILRRLNQRIEDDFKPVLTADYLPTIVGDIMPRLEAFGLDVSYDEVSLSAKRDASVSPSSLQTLYVGAISLSDVQIPQVARFLQVHLPDLQSLCYHCGGSVESPWPYVADINGYSTRFYELP